MNGYDAQDMAAQGADGFRNGYQAGYADAVKAIEASQPAAAQDAVVVDAYDDALDQLWKLAGGNDHPVYKRFLEFRETFAAPVTAAPADPEHGHIDPSWSLHDRVEFALRDAGFDLGEAAFVAEAASAAEESSPAAPGIDPKHDAENWGDALNEAGWTFLDACPEKSSLLFNNCKPALRAAILKYLELIDASPKGNHFPDATKMVDSPKGGSEARDAERYRKLRRVRSNPYAVLPVGEALDAHVDAMQAQAGDAEVQP